MSPAFDAMLTMLPLVSSRCGGRSRSFLRWLAELSPVRTPTETGLYRIWLKESEADMKGLNGEDPYSVATVPWTEFFSPEKGLALHTAYWHDGFGQPRSHGCVNLAPQDARWLYFWSDPGMPPGWTMTAGVVEAPGSIVRVRSAKDPDPPLRGYAIRVQESRQAAASGALTPP